MKKQTNASPLKKNKSKDITSNRTIFENPTIIYVLLGLSILIVVFARLHLLSFPFERDEGEYAYMGKLILDGHPPYTLAYNMKLRGTYFMYALIMGVFGTSVEGVHFGLLLVVVASMLLVFYIARHFVSKIGAVIASASFGIIGTSITLLAQAAHATHFVTFFALIAFLVLLQHYKTGKNKTLNYFISGFFFSLAFICKQSGLFFVLFGFSVILIKEFNPKSIKSLVRSLAIFSLGFAVPILLMLLYFYFFSDFSRFWFWTVKYLSKYGTQIALSDAPKMFKLGLIDITANYSSVGYSALWLISLLGIPFLFFQNMLAENKRIVLVFVLFSFLTVVPGFYFRHHYFITYLPAAGLLIAIFFEYFNTLFIQKLKMPNLIYVSVGVFIVLIGWSLYSNNYYLFKGNPQNYCKFIYGPSPFVESLEIARYLKHNTNQHDKIAVLGSEPQLYFYADRYAATGYIYTYNLVENHAYAATMQQEMAAEIELNKPKYILYVDITASWLSSRANANTFIFEWANEYTSKYYKLVGLYEIFPDKLTGLIVGEELNRYETQSKDIIYIFERLN